MQEVEVKVEIENTSSVITLLEKAGCVFSEPIHQDDEVFAVSKESMEAFLKNTIFLRLRVNNNTETIFTAKFDSRRSEVGMAAMEHETAVASRDQMEQILLRMGYQSITRTVKIRRKTRYKEYEICVDQVEGLGSFMEIEKMVPEDTDPLAVQEELVTVLTNLGIDLKRRVTKGYDILMLEKEGLT